MLMALTVLMGFMSVFRLSWVLVALKIVEISLNDDEQAMFDHSIAAVKTLAEVVASVRD